MSAETVNDILGYVSAAAFRLLERVVSNLSRTRSDEPVNPQGARFQLVVPLKPATGSDQ